MINIYQIETISYPQFALALVLLGLSCKKCHSNSCEIEKKKNIFPLSVNPESPAFV